MFEKFTERARKVMSLSRQHAQRLNNHFIGVEHVLLGLLEEGGGVAAETLKAMGIDKAAMKKEIEKIIEPGNEPSALLGQLPWSPRAKKILQLAEEEACRAGANVIGTEHLLLGLFMEGEGIPHQVLYNFKVTERVLRAKMKEVLGKEGNRIVGPVVTSERLVAIKVWLFRLYEGTNLEKGPTEGSLFYNNVRMEVSSVIMVDGIPFERQEAVGAALAKECAASAYLIEPVRK